MKPSIPPRFPLNFNISLSLARGEPSRSGITENISLSGIGLELEPVKSEVARVHFERAAIRGVPVDVRISIPEASLVGEKIRELRFTAKLVWHDQQRCGLQILDMTPTEKQFYESLIEGYQTLCRNFAALHRAA